MLKLILTLVFAATIPTLAAAQSRALESTEAARKASDGIISALAADSSSSALKELRPLSVIPSADFDVFEAQFNSQQANLLRQFGNPSGYEFLREDRLRSRLIRFQSLVFHEKAPLRWNIVFYRSEKGWVISHFCIRRQCDSVLPGWGLTPRSSRPATAGSVSLG
jgi:hypothetical protein